MPSVSYSKSAFRALAALPPEKRARVKRVADALAMPPGRDFDTPLRALPGPLGSGLAQVPVEGVGRIVCDIGRESVAILSLAGGGESGRALRRDITIRKGATPMGGRS